MTVNLAYCTPAEVRAQLGGKKAQDDDLLLKSMIAACARHINQLLGKPLGFIAESTASVRIYPGSGRSYQYIDECISITTVAAKNSPTDSTYTAWTAADWLAARGDPECPEFNATPYDILLINPAGVETWFPAGGYYGPRGFPPTVFGVSAPTVQVTARWGHAATIPEDIQQATVAQVARWYKRSEGAWEDTTSNPREGQLVYRELDPDIQAILLGGRYWRPALGRW